jgi:NAD+ synthase/NAD+ synthase (glutamine-hydrolysing)
VRLALGQIDTTIGDFAGNAAKIESVLARAEAAGADIAAVPELALCGYPPCDLLERPAFQRGAARALARLARRTKETALLVGTIVPNRQRTGKAFHNAAALLHRGRVRVLAKKTLLPTYDVFDEGRWFEPGDGCALVPFRGERIGLPICEDLWNDKDFWRARRLYHADPGEALVRRGATLVLSISASPFSEGKPHLRRRMLARYARDGRVPVAYLNLVGGNDELVFDGGSMVLDDRGRVAARAALFAEDLLVADVVRGPDGRGRVEPVAGEAAPQGGDGADLAPLESLRRALVLGIRDYAAKCGFRTAVLGLSGGIDSALVAALAVDALGKENVTGLGMPSPYSSEGSVADARALAENLGIRFKVLPIATLFEDAKAALAPVFAGRPEDVAEENVQSRLRGLLVMGFSNKRGALVLTTGNKSELAVGYCTLYGDMCGGLAPISDLPKMRVYALARHLNARASRPLIPESSLGKPPSAELRAGQKDEDSLPPYPVLDAVLEGLVERNLSVAAAARASGAPRALVEKIARMVDVSEYKRRQAAPGLKVSAKAFGTGRRVPIAQRSPL